MNKPERVLAEAKIGAIATVSVPLSEIAALRSNPGPPGAKPVALKHMKHADEQTVAGISALFHAIGNAGWQDRSFDDWGAMGIPRFLGRINIAYTVAKYLVDPSWSVSPNIIPNQSLHSLSGTMSLALSLHGPNFGVGGGPKGEPEGLITALSVMQNRIVPGLWVVITRFDPEPAPDENGVATNTVTCNAMAMALVPEGPQRGMLKLHSGDAPATGSGLIPYLRDEKPSGLPWRCPVKGLGTLELTLG